MSGGEVHPGGLPLDTSAASVEMQVDEGMLIVASALRLAMKNLLIVRAMRDRADYDEAALVAALRAEIGELIGEKEEESTRLEKVLHRARRRKGWASWHDDYRQQDVPVLELRAEITRRLLDRLRALSDDPAFLRGELTGARDAALDEIIGSRLAPSMPAAMDAQYPEQRERRLELLRQDIEQLRLRSW